MVQGIGVALTIEKAPLGLSRVEKFWSKEPLSPAYVDLSWSLPSVTSFHAISVSCP